jgi:hypothetical protein
MRTIVILKDANQGVSCCGAHASASKIIEYRPIVSAKLTIFTYARIATTWQNDRCLQ